MFLAKWTGSYTANDGVTLTYAELENMLFAMSSKEKMENWSAIKTGVFKLLSNDNASLLTNQLPNINWYAQTNDSLRSNYLFQLVTCTDEIKPLSTDEIIAKRYEYDNYSSLFSDVAEIWSTMCGYWPMQRDPIAPIQDMENVLTEQQVLNIAGKYDTNTPYLWAQEMVASFGDLAAFITVDNLADHGFSYTGLSCVDKNTTQYLLDPTIDIADETCSGEILQRKAGDNDKWKDHPVKRANPIKR